jgi:hypothetical protein
LLEVDLLKVAKGGWQAFHAAAEIGQAMTDPLILESLES